MPYPGIACPLRGSCLPVLAIALVPFCGSVLFALYPRVSFLSCVVALSLTTLSSFGAAVGVIASLSVTALAVFGASEVFTSFCCVLAAGVASVALAVSDLATLATCSAC